LGLELGVDFFALSFVREPKDILQLQAVISKSGRVPLVIAKIEDQQAVRNMHEIIEVADGIMIARGDLGIEIPYEELPIVQRKIVKLCHRVGKPVIVATHMLESMIENPLPTRAEVTDVANAVFEQSCSAARRPWENIRSNAWKFLIESPAGSSAVAARITNRPRNCAHPGTSS
jgi:pyruvate kinase